MKVLDWFLRFVLLTIASFVLDIVGAQLVCWGLAEEHVHSGLAGPYLILLGFSFVISASSSRKKDD